MNSDDKKKINAIMVVEVLGRPPEYLVETLGNIAEGIEKEQGVVVKEKRIMEPVVMKERPDVYSSFAEIGIEVEEILQLAMLVFKYMPAHMEIISPQNFNLSNSGFNDLFNELVRRLHGYEEVARILQTEKMILENQLKTILGKKEDEIKEDKKETKVKKPEKKTRKPRLKKAKEETEDIQEEENV